MTVDVTVNITAGDGNANVYGGKGSDTITISMNTDNSGDGNFIVFVDGRDGNDTISINHGTLATKTGSTSMVRIKGGSGKDIIEKVGDNGSGTASISTFTVSNGHSLVTSYDEITGFDLGVAGGAFLTSSTFPSFRGWGR